MNIVELLKELADDTRDSRFTNTYSGRCMYGKQCCGIITDNPYQLCLELGVKIGEANAQEDVTTPLETPEIQVDSMGRSTIVYFPDVQDEDADEDERDICPTCETEINDDGECNCDNHFNP